MWTVPYWSVCMAKGRWTCTASGVPVVLAGQPFGNDEDLSYVDADNVGGARMAVRYLLSAAAGEWPGGRARHVPRVDRLHRYRMTMAEAGLNDSGLIVFGDFGRVSAGMPYTAC